MQSVEQLSKLRMGVFATPFYNGEQYIFQAQPLENYGKVETAHSTNGSNLSITGKPREALYELAGGACQEGEQPLDAIKRETFSELFNLVKAKLTVDDYPIFYRIFNSNNLKFSEPKFINNFIVSQVKRSKQRGTFVLQHFDLHLSDEQFNYLSQHGVIFKQSETNLSEKPTKLRPYLRAFFLGFPQEEKDNLKP